MCPTSDSRRQRPRNGGAALDGRGVGPERHHDARAQAVAHAHHHGHRADCDQGRGQRQHHEPEPQEHGDRQGHPDPPSAVHDRARRVEQQDLDQPRGAEHQGGLRGRQPDVLGPQRHHHHARRAGQADGHNAPPTPRPPGPPGTGRRTSPPARRREVLMPTNRAAAATGTPSPRALRATTGVVAPSPTDQRAVGPKAGTAMRRREKPAVSPGRPSTGPSQVS